MPSKPISGPISAATRTVGGPIGPVVADERLVGLLGDWSEQGHGGLARRLAQALRGAITGGVLPGGTRLPPERQLAALLSVSRSTVTAALDELRAEDLLASRQGAGTEVIGRADPGSTGDRVGSHFASRATGIDLAAVVPTDGSHLPPMVVRTEDLLAARGQLEPHGLVSLREALAQRHTALGRLTEPDQIEVTHGAHHAIAVIIDALVAPGSTVALEDPSYPGVLDVLDHRRARAVAVRSDRGGPDPEALADVLRRERPVLVYLQTGVHNPTGRVVGPARRRALAQVLDDHGDAILVEDNTLADLAFDSGTRPPGFDALCRVAPVVSVESLSKVAWAALRIGWLRASGTVADRIARVRVANDLGPSVPSQLLALQLLPHLDAMAARRRSSLEQAVDAAVERFRADLPDWELERPEGSSALWPALPLADATAYVALARRHGVHVTPGGAHVVGGGGDPHLRLCVDRPATHVEEGIDRLVAAWRDLTTRTARTIA
ncbi:PLP-dependent aminotransferase family protein [Aquihabitans sp. G128]|uniref:aminotransferase-like domain-containing protein n=1 Tax=Aquihabitans sp. G128 TaxID=2849779 RepID=UPI001C248CB0|nr:PLP-dependent aminotransferase family protein [Aquihabitans sp. G128]QXC60247.1 PLP-dependent aminotransferase family protein [Aquihabitans sp. G128]